MFWRRTGRYEPGDTRTDSGVEVEQSTVNGVGKVRWSLENRNPRKGEQCPTGIGNRTGVVW